MIRVLVVGNKGSLMDNFELPINVFHTSKFYTESYSSKELFLINALVKSSEFLVFLGGEVRDEVKLFHRNFVFPKHLADLSYINGVKFVFLSSLSVFDGIQNYSGELSSSFPQRPMSKYGRSKYYLEHYLVNVGYNNFVGIRPASIARLECDKRSSKAKVEKLFKDYPLLKWIYFDSYYSYVYDFQIYSFIETLLTSEDFGSKRFLNLANNCNVSIYYKGPILIKWPSRLVICLLSHILPGIRNKVCNQVVFIQ